MTVSLSGCSSVLSGEGINISVTKYHEKVKGICYCDTFSLSYIAPDKRGVSTEYFSCFSMKTCFGYSLEALH